MLTHVAARPRATQQSRSPSLTIPERAHSGQGREVNWILHLQHTVGNQAVQRLLQANADGLEAGSRATTSDRVINQNCP